MNFENGVNELKKRNLHRALHTTDSAPGRGKEIRRGGRSLVDFGSNDYLGLRTHPEVIRASMEALERWGTGGGASRLITGHHPLCDALEKSVAQFKRYPAALVFGSGYLANATALPALAGEGGAILLDRLSHASLVDGARLSSGKILVYPHADPEGLEHVLKRSAAYPHRLVVTESVFSMDGDLAPLREIAALTRQYDALLYVDEAHAAGLAGREGRGWVDELGLGDQVDFTMGTFSKALGSLGGYIAASSSAIDYLVNAARGLMFATALPPAVLAASLKSVALAPGLREARERLARAAERVRGELRGFGFDTGKSGSQIVPVILGREERALRFQEALAEAGLFVPAVRFPAVQKGKARLRISLSAAHADEDIEKLVAEFKKLSREKA